MDGYTVEHVARVLSDLHDGLRHLECVLRACGEAERPGSGGLIIPREVFAYMDFLGAVYCGYRGETNRSGRRLIATSKKAVRFITEILGSIDDNYRRHGELAYTMVRHGTVHVYRPNKLRRRDGATIEWMHYIGERRSERVRYGSHLLTVNHLEPLLLEGFEREYVLPLSLNVLYEDLLAAINSYGTTLRDRAAAGDRTLLDNYGSTMAALMDPDDTDLTW